jgi:Ca2+-binding RTX toxin-like protein
MRLSPIIITALTVAAAMPAAASASQVSVDQGTLLFKSGAPASDVVLRGVQGGVAVTDSAQPLFVGPGCTTGAPVLCADAFFWDVRLGGGDDHFQGISAFPMTVRGGAGDDAIHAASQDTDVTGGPGNDDIWFNSNDTAHASGGDGNDRLYGWENGIVANGGSGDDLLVGDAKLSNFLDGNAGDDALVGTRGYGELSGGAGNDVIAVPYLGGLPGGWTLNGGPGDDLIQGSPLDDTISAGDGADTVSAVDGSADTIACGAGADTVYADTQDSVAKNCETVVRGSAPSLPAVNDAVARAEQMASQFN